MVLTNQKIVLKFLYWSGKEETIEGILKGTGLKKTQVYDTVKLLRKVGSVKTRYTPIHWDKGVWINRKIFINLADPRKTEFFLKKWGLI